MGTNSGAPTLPFQNWRHFKEAYTPELVARAIKENPVAVEMCLDPFGGSGTTAIASQFLGVEPVTIEVNPYLADLIQVKLTSYDTDALARDLGRSASVGHCKGQCEQLFSWFQWEPHLPWSSQEPPASGSLTERWPRCWRR